MLEKIKEHERRFSTAGTAIACCMAMLVITFWGYEEHVPAAVIGILRKIALCSACIVWIYSSFMRGLIKRTGFAIFTALYFTLPILFVRYADSITDPRKFDANVMIISDYFRLFAQRPFENMPVFSTMDPLTASVIFSSICLVVFIIGMFVGGKDKTEATPEEKAADDKDISGNAEAEAV